MSGNAEMGPGKMGPADRQTLTHPPRRATQENCPQKLQPQPAIHPSESD